MGSDHNAARVVDAKPTWSYDTLGEFPDAILGGSGMTDLPSPE